MTTKEVPVLLLTGYLGSGKTTLLNRILANRKGIKFAVIVNDIGEVNIDAALIEKGGVVDQKDDSLVALQNGCICCTLKMDLVKQLQDIVSQKRFDYIVIEASGICEPAPIAQTICNIPTLGPEYNKDGVARLDSIVTVVDALRLKEEFDNGNSLVKENIDEDDLESLVIQQIEFCNIILLNKASEVSADDRKRIKTIIRTIQPKAEIIECDYGDVDLDKLVNTHSFDFAKVAQSAGWLQEMEPEEEIENEESGEALEYGIGTFVYKRREPFSLSRFDEFCARKWPNSIIRAKGICYFDDERDMCYLFEQAGKQKNISQAGQWLATMPDNELKPLLEREERLRKEWDEKYGDRMIKLVFIGQKMDQEAICKELDACITK